MRIDNEEIREADIFEILLDNFPDIIHSVNEEGKIVYTNKKATELLEYTHEELIGMNVRDIYTPEVQAALEKGFSNLKQTGDKSVESALQSKSGEEIPVEIRSFSIYDDDGNFIRTFSILRDVRPIKQLQESLVHAGRLAAIGELASGVAHDINNPLTVILLSNEMAMRELENEEFESDGGNRIRTYTSDIHRASKSIQKLANHLRNFSRGMQEKFAPVDLVSCIEDALFITSNKINSNQVRLTAELEKGQHFTYGISNNIEQVFANLVSNACDAMNDCETRELKIWVEAAERDEGSFWACKVSDTGSGIPEDALKDVFNSFYTTKEKGKGTGLGLSIARGIIHDHKGDVEVTSATGEGTCFTVFFPVQDPAAPADS